MARRELTNQDDDDLFSPALAGVQHELPAVGRRPWRLSSQLYVGFFGGPLASTVIAWLNADRLRLSRNDHLQIAGAGLFGLAVAVVAAFLVGSDSIAAVRTIVSAAGIGTAAVQRPPQAGPDRRYATRYGDEAYDSLWGPGFLASIVLGTLLVAVLYVLTA